MTTTSTVTDAAVEAACRESYGEIWEASRADIAIRSARSAMRSALEAALPHLAPQPVVDRVALVALMNAHPIEAFNGSQVVCGCNRTWLTSREYREHLADAVLALLTGSAK